VMELQGEEAERVSTEQRRGQAGGQWWGEGWARRRTTTWGPPWLGAEPPSLEASASACLTCTVGDRQSLG